MVSTSDSGEKTMFFLLLPYTITDSLPASRVYRCTMRVLSLWRVVCSTMASVVVNINHESILTARLKPEMNVSMSFLSLYNAIEILTVPLTPNIPINGSAQ